MKHFISIANALLLYKAKHSSTRHYICDPNLKAYASFLRETYCLFVSTVYKSIITAVYFTLCFLFIMFIWSNFWRLDFFVVPEKRMYARLPEILSEVARKEMNRLRDYISECGCIYLPQIGYLLTTRSRGDGPDPKMEKLGFEFCVSFSGNGFCFKLASKLKMLSFKMRKILK